MLYILVKYGEWRAQDPWSLVGVYSSRDEVVQNSPFKSYVWEGDGLPKRSRDTFISSVTGDSYLCIEVESEDVHRYVARTPGECVGIYRKIIKVPKIG